MVTQFNITGSITVSQAKMPFEGSLQTEYSFKKARFVVTSSFDGVDLQGDDSLMCLFNYNNF